ncbi:MAG: hypothetical protein WBC91_09525 [Phototrophicaceae bacterium]
MSEKRKNQSHTPHGQLGQAFYFTRDDLAANRAGYMTLSQQFGFKFWERKAYRWLFDIPPFKWILGKRRNSVKIIGTIKKHYHSKVIFTGSGGSGGGHQEVLEQHRIQVLAPDQVVTFYVRERQYSAIPDNTELTVYYDPMEQRILSVELPYDS